MLLGNPKKWKPGEIRQNFLRKTIAKNDSLASDDDYVYLFIVYIKTH